MAERYSRNPSVELAPMRDECVLFNPKNNKFCLLNRTAALLWERLESPKTVEELAGELENHFSGVQHDQAVTDVQSVFRDLVATECVTSS